MKKAFTIVELLVVITVVGILLGMVTVAASGAVKASRDKQADALCHLVQTALATYHAQMGHWPDALQGKVDSGSFDRNEEGEEGESEDQMYVLKPSEVRAMVKAIVDETKKGNPLIDVSGLFVSRNPGEWKDVGRGMDFLSAVRGTKQSRRKMKTSEMYFGYPDSDGYFRRFKMIYAIPNDHLTVEKQTDPNKKKK